MADEDATQEDRTEDPTPERREEFRERGQIAVSREITSVAVLAAAVIFFTFYTPIMEREIEKLYIRSFEGIGSFRITRGNVLTYANQVWTSVLLIIFPLFIVTLFISMGTTFAQTRMNWSWKRMKPELQKFNIIKGVGRMMSPQAGMELFKGTGKMAAVGIVSWLILKSEWEVVPSLMNMTTRTVWAYWGQITIYLFWAVAGILLLIGGLDYLFNFIQLERKMRMTKKEVRDELKRREVDPHLKGRMRRMARDLAMRQTLENTKEATVLITNPTHYSIALKYELGMAAPIVVAKGVDFLALRMREVARELDIPIVENRPLARDMYANVEEGQEVPDRLYKAVAEIVRYVFRLKGRALSRSKDGDASEVSTD